MSRNGVWADTARKAFKLPPIFTQSTFTTMMPWSVTYQFGYKENFRHSAVSNVRLGITKFLVSCVPTCAVQIQAKHAHTVCQGRLAGAERQVMDLRKYLLLPNERFRIFSLKLMTANLSTHRKAPPAQCKTMTTWNSRQSRDLEHQSDIAAFEISRTTALQQLGVIINHTHMTQLEEAMNFEFFSFFRWWIATHIRVLN